MPRPLLVLTNLPDLAGAQMLARKLVEQRLVACANILPAVKSLYCWQGKIEEADEVSLFLKTTEARYAELEAALQAAHPYALPEIIALPIVAGLPAYLAWMAAETKKDVEI